MRFSLLRWKSFQTNLGLEAPLPPWNFQVPKNRRAFVIFCTIHLILSYSRLLTDGQPSYFNVPIIGSRRQFCCHFLKNNVLFEEKRCTIYCYRHKNACNFHAFTNKSELVNVPETTSVNFWTMTATLKYQLTYFYIIIC